MTVEALQIIVGVGRLVDLKKLCHIRLRQVLVHPQCTQMFQHDDHQGHYEGEGEKLLTFKGISLKIFFEVIPMIKGPKKTAGVILPMELYEWLAVLAGDTGRTVPEYIRQVLKSYLWYLGAV